MQLNFRILKVELLAPKSSTFTSSKLNFRNAKVQLLKSHS